jgi:hypothetical protein
MLTNTGKINLAITSVKIAGTDSADFAQTNNCPASLPPNNSCKIEVIFTAMGEGIRKADVEVADDASGSPQEVALSGTVQDFSLSVTSQESLTVTPGQAANYAIAVSPVNGFAQQVALTCGGAPPQSTCTVSPSSVTLSSGVASANVVAVTSGPSASLMHFGGFAPSGNKLAIWLGFSGLPGVVLLGGLGRSSRKRRSRLLYAVALMCVLFMVITWSACGGGAGSSGGGGGSTPAGTYNLTVVGTFSSGSANLVHSTKITLVVQ